MDYLSWDLSVLSKAVAYNNLSSASAHVGFITAPAFKNRGKARRAAKYPAFGPRGPSARALGTPAAFRLAEIYASTFQKLSLRSESPC